MPGLPITAGKASDTGRVRELNEDSLASLPIGRRRETNLSPRYVAAIADGMGGHSAGEVASRTAVEVFLDTVQGDGEPAVSLESGEDWVVRAFRAANEAVHLHSQVSETTSGMGTTLTGVAVFGDALHVAHVGDTRAYLLRGTAIRQVTEDDSWVAEQVEQGIMTEEEARSSEHRNILSRALGTRPDVPIHTYHESLQEGDVVILTTDGLHNSVSAPEMGDVLRGSTNVQEACEHLVQLARERDGSDNISVVCLAFGHKARRATTRRLPRVVDRSRRLRKLRALMLLVVLVAAALVAYGLGFAPSGIPSERASPAEALPAPPPTETSGDTVGEPVGTLESQSDEPVAGETRSAP